MNDLDLLRRSVTTTMSQISRHWRRLVHQFIAGHGVSDAAAYPLITISRLGDGIRQGVLAEAVGLEGPSLVRLLDQLCAADLVERREDPSDRRAKLLFLTARGRQVTSHVEKDLTALRERVLGDITQADLIATLRVFSVIETAANALAPHVGSEIEP